jgi:hypothetical protein
VLLLFLRLVNLRPLGRSSHRYADQTILPPDLRFNRTSLVDHCAFKYLLNLAGNAASNRLKYLFFCNATVVSPVRAGGFGGAGPGNEYEEFFFHRLQPNVTVTSLRNARGRPKVVEHEIVSFPTCPVDLALLFMGDTCFVKLLLPCFS